MLVSGLVGWLVLLAIAESIMMLVGIEANTRAMAQAHAPAASKESTNAS
jgi:hypothetical protein